MWCFYEWLLCHKISQRKIENTKKGWFPFKEKVFQGHPQRPLLYLLYSAHVYSFSVFLWSCDRVFCCHSLPWAVCFIFKGAWRERRVVLMVMDGFSPVAETQSALDVCLSILYSLLMSPTELQEKKKILPSRSQISTLNSYYLNNYLKNTSSGWLRMI